MRKIVSLDPAATATLYALGAFKYLVGGNCFDTYPPNENLTNVQNMPGFVCCGIDIGLAVYKAVIEVLIKDKILWQQDQARQSGS